MSQKRKDPRRDDGEGLGRVEAGEDFITSPDNTAGESAPALTGYREKALRRWPPRILEGDGAFAVVSADDPRITLHATMDQAVKAKRDIHERIARGRCMQ